MEYFNLEELERLAAQITPLPWRVADKGYLYVTDSNPNREIARLLMKPRAYNANAAYIVAACNSLPDLIAENRALRERVRELERQKRVLVEKMAIDILCSECSVSEACPYENATFIDLEDCAKQLEKWSEQAAKEAGE